MKNSGLHTSKLILSVAILLVSVLVLSGCNKVITSFFGRAKSATIVKSGTAVKGSAEKTTIAGTGTMSASASASDSGTESPGESSSIGNSPGRSLRKAVPTFNLKDKEGSKFIITVYYRDKDGYIIPVSRAVEKQEAIARAAVNEIISNSKNENLLSPYGLKPVLHHSAVIKGINLKDKLATIDFSGTPFQASSLEEEAGMVAALVYTLTAFDTIDKVRIQVEGYEIDELTHGTKISGILDRNNIMLNTRKANLSAGLSKSDIFFYKTYDDEASGNSYNYLVPVSVEHTKVTSEVLPEKLLELYDMNYGDSNLISLLPKQISASSITVSSGIAAIDIEEPEPDAMSQIMHAFKQIQGITGIKTKSASGYYSFPDYINAYIE